VFNWTGFTIAIATNWTIFLNWTKETFKDDLCGLLSVPVGVDISAVRRLRCEGVWL